eukprot:455858-Amorphochlora_amoeboformis.AAC.1
MHVSVLLPSLEISPRSGSQRRISEGSPNLPLHMSAICTEAGCVPSDTCTSTTSGGSGGSSSSSVNPPAWVIILLIMLLLLSGLFSGLNLGLMSLDKIGLEIVLDAGSSSEKKYAKALLPLRKMGNLLLCTLLLGNTAVNAVLAILMSDLTGGIIGSISTTFGIVIFGEIIPQSLCSRNGLAIGYYTRQVVWFFMVAMYIIAK